VIDKEKPMRGSIKPTLVLVILILCLLSIQWAFFFVNRETEGVNESRVRYQEKLRKEIKELDETGKGKTNENICDCD
jgi:hypothetical protein